MAFQVSICTLFEHHPCFSTFQKEIHLSRDPWYGQICTTYQDTFEDDALSHGLGAGVRVEVTDTFLLCLGVNNVWQDFGGSYNDTTEIFSVRMDIGWKF